MDIKFDRILSYCSFGHVQASLHKFDQVQTSLKLYKIVSYIASCCAITSLNKFEQVLTSSNKFEIVSNCIIHCIMLCNMKIINKTEHPYHFISAISKFEETSYSENSKKTKIFLNKHLYW